MGSNTEVSLSALALIAAMVLARHNPDVQWFAPLTWACLAGMVVGAGVSALAGVLGWAVLGLGERVTHGAYLIWLFVLALVAVWAERRQGFDPTVGLGSALSVSSAARLDIRSRLSGRHTVFRLQPRSRDRARQRRGHPNQTSRNSMMTSPMARPSVALS
jgi:hypothetical protein